MESGVQGEPLRLLVATIVVGLMAPAVFSGLVAFEAQQASVGALVASDGVLRAAHALYLYGGGVRDIRVQLPHGVASRVEYVQFGDEPGGSLATTVRIKVTGQPETILLADPPVPMTAGAGALLLPAGVHRVRVSYAGEGPVRLAVIP